MDVLRTRAGRAVAAANGLIALLVVVGVVALWPGDATLAPAAGLPSLAESLRARVAAVTPGGGGCRAYSGPECRLVALELLEGPDAGRRSSLTLADRRFSPEVDVGQELLVARSQAPAAERSRPETQPYAFVDFERRRPLLVLALAFAALVVALARWQGARALLGLALSLGVVVLFVAPAILAGASPLLVALVGSLAVMLVTIALTHGIGLKSQAAMLGTTASLGLIAVLGAVAIAAASITGLSEEASLLLDASRGGGADDLSLQGLLLAGLVIGALGVLDDVTVSQASTVLALRRVDERLGFRRLFAEALAVGRDHLGATVNTLVLAYAGAALPALLIFSSQGVGFAAAVNFESVAAQVVAMLVGSIGLTAAVPLTTALAAALAVRLPAGALPRDAHGH